MMGTFLFLATEAKAVGAELTHATSEGGFGLNFDILETNLINLAILIGVLFYFGRKFIGKILTERRSKIETAIEEAQSRQKEAAAALSDAQQKLTQAQTEAQRIRAAAEESAQKAKEAIMAKAADDVERIKQAAAVTVDSMSGKAIAELRQQVTAMAMQRVESQLSARLNNDTQQQLIDRSIALLGGS